MLRPKSAPRSNVRFDESIRRSIALALSTLALLVPRAVLAQAPPDKGPDMELDPDAKPESPPLPPVQEGDWGVGGKEEEGKFAPSGLTGAKKREEDEKAEAAKA